jgi:hypothetical protein
MFAKFNILGYAGQLVADGLQVFNGHEIKIVKCADMQMCECADGFDSFAHLLICTSAHQWAAHSAESHKNAFVHPHICTFAYLHIRIFAHLHINPYLCALNN